MGKLPIGIQSFDSIREDNYIYVDKTEYIWNLVWRNKVYFLSRPRRFGKSLFLSTLKAYFEGRKELFRGLKIEALEEENSSPWEKYPIIYFSFATGNYKEEGALKNKIDGILSDYEKAYEIHSTKKEFGDRFLDLIAGMKEKAGKGVVVLIDEYDKPLLDNLSINKDLEEKNRGILKGFYGALKDADENLKFVFITGVTKFSKVSLFSDLNQLNDISLNREYAGICGITEEELENSFSEEIDELALDNDLSREECISELKKNYDGYHFSAGKVGVYNPFSLLNCFSKKMFGRYWFATGTPTFLINSLAKAGRPIEELINGISAKESRMENYRADEDDFIPLFYQAGYLTIMGYDRKFNSYELAFPNEEVEYGFLDVLIPLASPKYEAPDSGFSDERMTKYLCTGDVESFMKMLRALLASIPYHEGQGPQNEQQWRNIIYAVFKILGQYVFAEIHSSNGRSDCMVETDSIVYIFEFKNNKSADEALNQINEKGYALPYSSSGKRIVKIGANFSNDIMTLDEWKMEED